MSIPNPLRIRILSIVILLFGSINSIAQCKNIEADIKVVKTVNDTNNSKSIIIDFNGSKSESFKVSLFGPDRKNVLNSEKTEFSNLDPGKYLVVIVGKLEEDHYCPKSINVTIN